MTALHPPGVGDRLGDRYELLDPIATGGMAQVWRAVDSVLGREVAVKVLHPHLATDRGFLLRFRREAVAAARLSHPSIVSIYDTVSENGTEAIVMELIHGRTLRAVLDDVQVMGEADAIEVGTQIADALADAHRGGVVHRDIKPSNILLCPDRRVMVTDFGIAKAGEDTDLTVTGTLLGTAKDLAPEQVNGDPVDARADLYALGIVLFEALTGRPPFKADTDAATALARLHQPPPRAQSIRPEVSNELDAIVHRLMGRSPESRFASATDVRAALSGVPRHANGADATLVVADATAAAQRPSHALTTPPVNDGDDIAIIDDHEFDQDFDDDLDEPGFLRSERSWILPALLLALTAAALVVAVQLFANSPLASSLGDESATVDEEAPEADPDVVGSSTTVLTVTPVVEPSIVGARTLDSPALGGDGTENDDLVGGAFDGDDDTSWRSDTYRRPDFGQLKTGVGLILDLGGQARVEEIDLQTNSEDWTIEFYVGDSFGDDPASWGEPVAVIVDGDGRERIDDIGAVGSELLLWITDHGLSEDGSDEGEEDDHRFELAEIIVSG